jgi:hypothetical protein
MKQLISTLLILLTISAFSRTSEVKNQKEFNSFLKYANTHNLSNSKKNNQIVKIGKYFLDKPYVAKTLEINKKEQLVVNLCELDCTTFMETVVNLYRTINSNNPNYATYKNLLQNFRYRNGTINGYESRLHYFIDLIQDNELKNSLTNITKKIGGIELNKEINFMSSNSKFYPMLKGNVNKIKTIEEVENNINKRIIYFIPQNQIVNIEDKINDGDIIGLVTNIDGLDCVHVGFAIKQNGRVHLFHASSAKKKVVISKRTLEKYVKSNKKQIGIIVARIK